MQVLYKVELGPFLVISSVLALWTLLAAGSVQAHDSTVSLPAPSCGNLPSEQGFLTAIPLNTTTALTADDSATTRGGGVTGRGDTRFRYARITVPALAAGELRVFDDTATNVSDAVLCQGSSPVARSITSYSAHNTALAAANRADDMDDTTTTDAAARATAAAAAAAAAVADDLDDPNDPAAQAALDAAEALDNAGNDNDALDDADFDDDGTPGLSSAERAERDAARRALSSALSSARSALSSARSALSSARTALGTATRALHAANAAAAAITAATQAEQDALTAYNAAVLPSSSLADIAELQAVITALGNDSSGAVQALNAASTALNAASTALNAAANAMHTGFQIRAPVSPGDEEYIVVVASQTPNTDLAVNVAFHGVIATTSSEKRQRVLSAGTPQNISLTITTPGLLTLETTGNTDTIGTLVRDPDNTPDNADDIDIAQAESGGSGGNFKMVVPVNAANVTYHVSVEGQTTRTGGAYTLDMDFNVAMPISGVDAGVATTAPTASPWGSDTDADVYVSADDATVQIQRRAADGNVADEDYFLFTPASAGFLTVNANDDDTPQPDANTRGTLFGAMGTGPVMDLRFGQIATDDNSGPGGTHFQFAVPVEGSKNYLVKVEGTDGKYVLEFHSSTLRTDNAQTVTSTAPTARYLITDEDGMRKTNYGDGDLCDQTGNRSNEIWIRPGTSTKIGICSTLRNPGPCTCIRQEPTDVRCVSVWAGWPHG